MTTYNDKLSQEYETIRTKVRAGKLPLVARVPAIDKAVGEYALAQAERYENKRAEAEAAGRSPNTVPIPYRDASALERYADLVLYEELKWSHPDKMTIVEYPIMTGWQEELRDDKYIKLDEITYRDRQHNGRKKASYFGKDGEVGVTNPKMADRYDERTERIEGNIDVMSLLKNANLTNRQRQVIDLIFFEDMTQEEAGAELSVSQQAVKKHLDAGLRRIRESLTKKVVF